MGSDGRRRDKNLAFGCLGRVAVGCVVGLFGLAAAALDGVFGLNYGVWLALFLVVPFVGLFCAFWMADRGWFGKRGW